MRVTGNKTKQILMTGSDIAYGHGVIADLNETLKQNLLVAQRMFKAVEEMPNPGYIHFEADAILIDLEQHEDRTLPEMDTVDDKESFKYLQDDNNEIDAHEALNLYAEVIVSRTGHFWFELPVEATDDGDWVIHRTSAIKTDDFLKEVFDDCIA